MLRYSHWPKVFLVQTIVETTAVYRAIIIWPTQKVQNRYRKILQLMELSEFDLIVYKKFSTWFYCLGLPMFHISRI